MSYTAYLKAHRTIQRQYCNCRSFRLFFLLLQLPCSFHRVYTFVLTTEYRLVVAMASINAAVALRLQNSPTYEVVLLTYKASWLAYYMKIAEADMEPPADGQIFGDGEVREVT